MPDADLPSIRVQMACLLILICSLIFMVALMADDLDRIKRTLRPRLIAMTERPTFTPARDGAAGDRDASEATSIAPAGHEKTAPDRSGAGEGDGLAEFETPGAA